MNDSNLIIDSPTLHKTTGLSQKRTRSRIPRKNWYALIEKNNVVVRPSEIEYLRENRDALFDHRMFYKPIWHTLIIFLSMGIVMGVGGLVYLMFQAATGSQWMAGVTAIIPALAAGIIGSRILAKGFIAKLRRSLYAGKVDAFINSLHATPLGILLDEVDRFNESAEDLEKQVKVMAELQDAGHEIDSVSHKKMQDIYSKTRDSLIRAMNTERIFRENKMSSLADIDLNFHSFATGEFDDQAREYHELLQRAMEIGPRIQERIRELERQ